MKQVCKVCCKMDVDLFPRAIDESLTFIKAACHLESSGAGVTVLVAVVPSLQLTAVQKALD